MKKLTLAALALCLSASLGLFAAEAPAGPKVLFHSITVQGKPKLDPASYPANFHNVEGKAVAKPKRGNFSWEYRVKRKKYYVIVGYEDKNKQAATDAALQLIPKANKANPRVAKNKTLEIKVVCGVPKKDVPKELPNGKVIGDELTDTASTKGCYIVANTDKINDEDAQYVYFSLAGLGL